MVKCPASGKIHFICRATHKLLGHENESCGLRHCTLFDDSKQNVCADGTKSNLVNFVKGRHAKERPW